MANERTSNHVFVGFSVLLFIVTSGLTAVWCRSMSAMRSMEMPGGWTMSMAWMRMPGQSWTGSAASFTGMWALMMVAMMLPSLVPMLHRYREAISDSNGPPLGWLTMLVFIGYLLIWTGFGLAVYPAGVVLAMLEMNLPVLARAVPYASAGIILAAGAVQFSQWKLRYLACCRQTSAPSCTLTRDSKTALSHGLRLGVDCSLSCANLTAILLVAGVMDLRAMLLITAAITAERLAPNGKRVAQAAGVAIIGIGLFVCAWAISVS